MRLYPAIWMRCPVWSVGSQIASRLMRTSRWFFLVHLGSPRTARTKIDVAVVCVASMRAVTMDSNISYPPPFRIQDGKWRMNVDSYRFDGTVTTLVRMRLDFPSLWDGRWTIPAPSGRSCQQLRRVFKASQSGQEPSLSLVLHLSTTPNISYGILRLVRSHPMLPLFVSLGSASRWNLISSLQTPSRITALLISLSKAAFSPSTLPSSRQQLHYLRTITALLGSTRLYPISP